MNYFRTTLCDQIIKALGHENYNTIQFCKLCETLEDTFDNDVELLIYKDEVIEFEMMTRG